MTGKSVILYVNAESKQAGNGELSTPFASVQAAYDAAVSEINAGNAESVCIHLLKGVHRINSELYLNGNDITGDTYKITFSGEGSDSVITPTVDIPGKEFQSIGGNIYAYRLPESAKDKDGRFPGFRDLYLDCRHLSIARFKGELLMKADSGAYADKFGLSATDKQVYVSPAVIKTIPTDSDGYFLLTDVAGNLVKDDAGKPIRTMIDYCVKTEWQCHFLHAERVAGQSDKYFDAVTGEPDVGIQIRDFDWEIFVPGYKVTGDLKNCPYWCQNHPSYLNSDDEFYYNADAGIIFLYSETGLDGNTVSYPVAERVFHLENIRNVTIEKLSVYGTTMNYTTKFGLICGQGGASKIPDPVTGEKPGFLPYAGIYGNNVENIRIDACQISDLGNDGIFCCGAVCGVSVTNCVLENIGGSALRFGQAHNIYNDTIHTKDIVIRNNKIHNTGFYNPTDPAVMITSVLNLDLSHNTITHCQYSGISIGYCWSPYRDESPEIYDTDSFVNVKNADISYNYIAEYMIGMSDGGAIYALGGNATKQQKNYLNSMNHNVAVLVSDASDHGMAHCMTYYHDSGASHWHDYDNMILISKSAPPPVISYIYYDAVRTYSNKTERLYIVGYPIDHVTGEEFPVDYRDSTNATIVGWYTVLGTKTHRERKEGFKATVDALTGAYDVTDIYYKDLDDVIEEVYMFRDFNDTRLTKDADSAMREIYGGVGCSFADKPPYGVLPND